MKKKTTTEIIIIKKKPNIKGIEFNNIMKVQRTKNTWVIYCMVSFNIVEVSLYSIFISFLNIFLHSHRIVVSNLLWIYLKIWHCNFYYFYIHTQHPKEFNFILFLFIPLFSWRNFSGRSSNFSSIFLCFIFGFCFLFYCFWEL